MLELFQLENVVFQTPFFEHIFEIKKENIIFSLIFQTIKRTKTLYNYNYTLKSVCSLQTKIYLIIYDTYLILSLWYG